MSNLTFEELAAFLATPQAQALATDAEKIQAAKDWKAALEAQQTPVVPAYDPVPHLVGLKAERAEWGQAWRAWSTDEQKAIRLARIAAIDVEIADVEAIIAAG